MAESLARTRQAACRPVKFRELIQMLQGDGWRQAAQRGSHRQYRHPTKLGRVTVAGKPNQDVTPGPWEAS